MLNNGLDEYKDFIHSEMTSFRLKMNEYKMSSLDGMLPYVDQPMILYHVGYIRGIIAGTTRSLNLHNYLSVLDMVQLIENEIDYLSDKYLRGHNYEN